MQLHRSPSFSSDEAPPSSPDSLGSASPDHDTTTEIDGPDDTFHARDQSPDRRGFPCLPSPEGGFADAPVCPYQFPPSPSYSPVPVDPPAAPFPSADEGERRLFQARFMRAVQEGDSGLLRQFLSSHSEMVQVDGFTADGQTALTQSCLDGNLEMVKVLVSHGASVHLANRDGFSPLHVACWCGKLDLVHYLLSTGQSNR